MQLHPFCVSALNGDELSVSLSPPLHYVVKNRVPIEDEVGWVPETVWMFFRIQKSVPLTGIRNLNHQFLVLDTIPRLPPIFGVDVNNL